MKCTLWVGVLLKVQLPCTYFCEGSGFVRRTYKTHAMVVKMQPYSPKAQASKSQDKGVCRDRWCSIAIGV